MLKNKLAQVFGQVHCRLIQIFLWMKGNHYFEIFCKYIFNFWNILKIRFLFFKRKPNSFWPSFTHPPLNQDLIKPHQSETNTALLELLQNSKPNDNSIINNTLLSNIFSQFNADSNASSNNSLNTNDTQSKSIWTPFPSNFN